MLPCRMLVYERLDRFVNRPEGLLPTFVIHPGPDTLSVEPGKGVSVRLRPPHTGCEREDPLLRSDCSPLLASSRPPTATLYPRTHQGIGARRERDSDRQSHDD